MALLTVPIDLLGQTLSETTIYDFRQMKPEFKAFESIAGILIPETQLVIDRGIGKYYNLYTPNDSINQSMITAFAVQGADGIIYYLNNRAFTLAAYRQGVQLWIANYRYSSFTYSGQEVHGIWFDDNFIYLACGTCEGKIDKRTGRISLTGCD
ncbi:hypothetical protein [Hymenobacter metallilatus]|uniref:WG repeat-containing protein n=1 Tax=Hymenobacter metallilatus TaxID=2493666 RepID=A0A428JRC7_9BACT|nr:hypothetical protein [Hymenobacter metallilatus]RSK36124.1 hypothetical protein EI290_04355 [Hymenobacter metallilatus]